MRAEAVSFLTNGSHTFYLPASWGERLVTPYAHPLLGLPARAALNMLAMWWGCRLMNTWTKTTILEKHIGNGREGEESQRVSLPYCGVVVLLGEEKELLTVSGDQGSVENGSGSKPCEQSDKRNTAWIKMHVITVLGDDASEALEFYFILYLGSSYYRRKYCDAVSYSCLSLQQPSPGINQNSLAAVNDVCYHRGTELCCALPSLRPGFALDMPPSWHFTLLEEWEGHLTSFGCMPAENSSP